MTNILSNIQNDKATIGLEFKKTKQIANNIFFNATTIL